MFKLKPSPKAIMFKGCDVDATAGTSDQVEITTPNEAIRRHIVGRRTEFEFEQSLLASRNQWGLKHSSLFEHQVLIGGGNCHGDINGCKGWAPGWLTCTPPAHVVIDLGATVLVTKMSIRNTNILASPRTMILSVSDRPDGPWIQAYQLSRTQCNRLALDVPGNTDANGNESSSDESYYFLGHSTCDLSPTWSHRQSGGTIDEQDPQMMASRGMVNFTNKFGASSRYWKLDIKDANGGGYVGINNFTFFGVRNPLAAPDQVTLSVVTLQSKDSIKIEWNYTAAAESFIVVAFPHDIGRGVSGIVRTANGSDRNLTFDGLKPDIPYVFIVHALDSDGNIGCPSKPSEPMAIQCNGWTILQFDQEDVISLPDSVAEDPVDTNPDSSKLKLETTDDATWSMSEYEISVSADALEEGRALKDLLRGKRGNKSQQSVEEFAALYETSIQSLMEGRFDEVDRINVATTVTTFISSTYADTATERNYLMDFAYPILKAFCQGLGLTFSVVDLRWGVRNEATDDHMTIEVCIGELERCLRNSTAASFLFLSSEKYGWRALPHKVKASEFESILNLIPAGESKDVILQWYLKDDNQTPPVYILQKISEMKRKKIRHNDFWNGAQDLIQETIRAAVRSSDLSYDIKHNWMVSVTEREVMSGIFGQECNTEIDALVLMRTLDGLEEAAAAGDEHALTYYTDAEEDRKLVYDLRARVKNSVHPDNFREFEVPWRKTGVAMGNEEHRGYIREFSSEFISRTEQQIRHGLAKRRLLKPLEREVMHHHSFAQRRARGFFGRKKLRDDLRKLVGSAGPVVRVVHGLSGSGKTSAMCVAAVEAAKEGASHGLVVMFRACGTSAGSSSGMELMRSLCDQIARVYELEISVENDFDGQVLKFHEALAASTAQKPLLIVIDSLDQLVDQHRERSEPWIWLPADSESMPHTRIVISTLPEAKYGPMPSLRARLPPEFLVEVAGVPPGEAWNVLAEWLSRGKRTLQENQVAAVKKVLEAAGVTTMLYLRLLHDRVAGWTSYDSGGGLRGSVREMIDLIFDDLERMHGKGLVVELMCLLAASRCGLSEGNLLDLISGNDRVLGIRGKPGSVLEFHDPPTRRLPPLVFSRLRRDMGDYLVERGENGVVVLNLYHRQFWEAVMDRHFRAPEVRLRCHQTLTEYFSGALASRFPDRGIDPQPLRFDPGDSESLGVPNRQKIMELPFALKKCGNFDELMRMLCDLRYLEAVFEAGRAYAEHMLVDFNDCLLHLQSRAGGGETSAELQTAQAKVTGFRRFVGKWFDLMCQHPGLMPSLAANSPASSEVARAAQGLNERRPWFQWLNAPSELDACVQTQTCPAPVACCRFSPSGSEFVVASGSDCIVFDCLSSRQVARFGGHSNRVEAVCFSPDGTRVLSGAREGNARIWDKSTGQEVHALGLHLSWVTACDWSRHQGLAITGGADARVYLWDPENGVLMAMLEGHTGPVHGCRFLGKSLRAVTGAEDGAAVVWDLERRGAAARLAGGSPVNGVDATADGQTLAIAASNKSCSIWSAVDGGGFSVRHRLVGHSSEVWACCFSPQGTELATACADRVGRVYCARTGQLLGKVQGHLQWPTSLDWSGNIVLTASCDKSVKMWDRRYVLPQKDAPSSELPERQVAGLRLLQGGTRLAGVTKNLECFEADLNPLCLAGEWRLQPGKKGSAGGNAALSPDGTTWGFTSYDSSFTLLHRRGEVMVITQRSVPANVANTTVRWNPTDPNLVLVGGHGGPTNVTLMDLARDQSVAQWIAPGWVQDICWAPDGRGAFIAAQRGTVHILDALAGSPAREVAPAALSVSADVGGARVAVVTMEGGGYDLRSTGCVVVDVEQGDEDDVCSGDPSVTRANLGCRWAAGGRLVLVGTSGDSNLGVPALSAYDTVRGECVARFCSPHASNFECVDVSEGPRGTPLVALADRSGRVFLLELRNLPDAPPAATC